METELSEPFHHHHADNSDAPALLSLPTIADTRTTPPLPSYLVLTRTGRVVSRVPKRYRDVLPAPPNAIVSSPPALQDVVR